MIPIVAIVAFISEYLDSGLGMGYGTALAPILIIMGYEPLKIVPAILISQLATDIAACVMHHKVKNVNFAPSSKDFKVALLLGLISAVGVTISALIAIRIPKWLLSMYIGILVFSMGILIFVTATRPMKFSWRKIGGISFLASFNKGISGGGYGPLVMGGQMLSGIHVKNAVGITAFSEAITCLVGFMIYLASGRAIDWKLVWVLIASAILAVPVAALTVKNTNSARLKRYVAVLMIILGLFTILKISGGQ